MPIFSDFFKSRRNKINCTYRACVECFNDVDCNGNLVCYGKCVTRQQKQKLQQAAAEAARRREEQRQRDQQQTAAGAAYLIQQQEKKRNEK